LSCYETKMRHFCRCNTAARWTLSCRLAWPRNIYWVSGRTKFRVLHTSSPPNPCKEAVFSTWTEQRWRSSAKPTIANLFLRNRHKTTSTLGGGGGGGKLFSMLLKYEIDSFAPGCWPMLTALFIISSALWKFSLIVGCVRSSSDSIFFHPVYQSVTSA
jgi:hypothetical protein